MCVYVSLAVVHLNHRLWSCHLSDGEQIRYKDMDDIGTDGAKEEAPKVSGIVDVF